MKGNVYEWYVVYTKPGMEKKVAGSLQKKNIEAYCPVNKVESKWWKFKKVTEQPIFSSYVFVRTSEAEIKTLRQVQGVVNVLYWLGKPAVVQDYEIGRIKNFLTTHTNVSVQKTAVSYSYSNSTSQVFGSKVELPTLGYAMVAKEEATAPVITMHEAMPMEQQQLSIAG